MHRSCINDLNDEVAQKLPAELNWPRCPDMQQHSVFAPLLSAGLETHSSAESQPAASTDGETMMNAYSRCLFFPSTPLSPYQPETVRTGIRAFVITECLLFLFFIPRWCFCDLFFFWFIFKICRRHNSNWSQVLTCLWTGAGGELVPCCSPKKTWILQTVEMEVNGDINYA